MNVHYYEQGNVQLAATHTVSLDLPPAITLSSIGSAAKIIALIEAEESRYQASLNEVYQEMGDKTFKSLRRALPMTRAKLDWDKVRLNNRIHFVYSLNALRSSRTQVLGYKIGAELSANKGGFGAS